MMDRRQRNLGWLSLLAVGLLSSAAYAAPVVVDVVADPGDPGSAERHVLYSASHALVIGIDDYSGGWPDLANAVRDANLVGNALESQGFEVERLIDPTGAELRAALRHFYAIRGADPEARLFLWFAGHGHTALGEGYLVGSDAPPPSEPAFLLEALHMREIGSMARLARAKHALAVFDSCFSGTVFTAQRALPPPAITRAVIQPVRQFITSGDADQLVSDDGTFRHLFVTALAGETGADLNGDGYLTGSELGLHIEDRMTNLTEARQTPRSGKLRDMRFDRGDFVFVLPGTESGTPTGPAADRSAEMMFWDAIKNSVQAREYRAYIEAFPSGVFVPIAEARLEILAEAGQPDVLAKSAGAVAAGSEQRTPETVPVKGEAAIAETAGNPPTDHGAPPASTMAAPLEENIEVARRPGPGGAPDPRAFEDARDLLASDQRRLKSALAAYEGLRDRMVGAPVALSSEDLKIVDSRVLAARPGGALIALDLRIRASFGWTVMSEVFTIDWSGGRLDVIGHGGAARSAFSARG